MITKIREAVSKLSINNLDIIELYYLILLLKELEVSKEENEILQSEDYCD